MRTYNMSEGYLECLIQSGSYTGHLSYDFNEGALSGHKPENMPNLEWFKETKNFLSICRRMIINVDF